MASCGMDSLLSGEGGFLTLAATVLCCYEHIITLGEEMRCVWRKGISGASVLFVLNRYAILAASLASIVQLLPWDVTSRGVKNDGPHNDAICSVSVRVVDACLILVNIAYAIFAALRMFALYGLSKPVFTVVLFLGLLNPCAQIFLMAIEYASAFRYEGHIGPIGTMLPAGRINCYHSIRPSFVAKAPNVNFDYVFPALRIHALVLEALLIGLTWKKTLSRWSLQKAAIRTPFTTMLLRDGTLYFFVIGAASTLSAVGMTMYLVSNVMNPRMVLGILALSWASPIFDTLTSICMSRFILDLRALSLDNGSLSAHVHSSQWKTLRFATVVEDIAESFVADLRDGGEGGDTEEGIGEGIVGPTPSG